MAYNRGRVIFGDIRLNMLWRSSERSIRDSVRNAMQIAHDKHYRLIGMPLIGAGSGGGKSDRLLDIIKSELDTIEFAGDVVVVRYVKNVGQ